MNFGREEIQELHKRVGHVTVAYKHLIVVWGGVLRYQTNFRNDKTILAEQIWFYNTLTELWTLAECTGDVPLGHSGSTGVVCGDFLYLFGGLFGENSEFKYSNGLYRLNLKTLVWTQLNPTGPAPKKCDKGVGWEYKNKLYFFGGYGEGPSSLQRNIESTFLLDINNQGFMGWNNQFICYDPEENAWSIPKVKGVPPNPRAAHAADIIGHLAFISGGREGDTRNNDLYCINMETFTWSSNLNSGKESNEVPGGLSWHSFSFVSPNKAVLYGGLKQYGSPSLEWWECTISENNEVSWKVLPKLMNPLIWHKAAYSKITGEVIIVGGVHDSPYERNEKDCEDKKLVVLAYQPISLFRLCLNVIVSDKALQLFADILPKPLMDLVAYRSEQSTYLL
ncbi:kelch domain-containing protein 2-like isoform X2 [Cimex lectularius]|uniref:Kelch repeat-containing protein n=1 Tax=Cimex lectularius TaxID=79782 RepID=A0A8I6RI92_CIMLE|nr:kelch domain-containing protein 2-like isoform X2 [Cimex lectularius]